MEARDLRFGLRQRVGPWALGGIAALVALLGFAALATAASASFLHSPSGSFASPGSGDGQIALTEQSGIAVNDTSHDIYVADTENRRVDQFTANGAFVRSFGADVGGSGIDVCASGCVAGSGSSAPGGFETPTFIAVDNSGGASQGSVYVGDVSTNLVSKFGADGVLVASWGAGGQLDGSTAFGGPFTEIAGIAVDAAGNLNVLQTEPRLVFQFADDGTPTTEVSMPRGTARIGLAVGPEGSFYKSNGNRTVERVDSAGTDLGQVTAAESATGLAVDNATGELFVDTGTAVDTYFFSPSGEVVGSGCTPAEFAGCTPPASGNFGSGSITSGGGIGVDGASHAVYVSDYGASQIRVFAGVPSPPKVGNERVTGISPTEATLEAEVNPAGSATAFHFEYGQTTAYGASTLATSAGSGETTTFAEGSLTGLVPGTFYHWRVVATSAAGTTEGADHTFFTTPTPPARGGGCQNQAVLSNSSTKLANCRGYEMVSPVDKNNTDIFAPLDIASLAVILDQAADDGEALTYTTSQGFGDSTGVPYTGQYIASRGPSGWSSHSITAPQGVSPAEAGVRVDLEFRAFTDDLCSAALLHTTAPIIAPNAVEGYFNIYRRDNCGSERYTAVTTSTPPNVIPDFFKPVVQGLSDDGNCTVFYANDQLTPDANPRDPANPANETNLQLYESCGDGPLHLVSVLPDGQPSTVSSSVGTAIIPLTQGSRRNTIARAVSFDGTRIYWTASPERGPLYVRVNATQPQSAIAAGECIETAKACTISVSTGNEAHFWSASADGSRAVFGEGPPGQETLYDFSLASRSSTPIASGVAGIMGASEDASRVAFVSREAFSGVNSQGKEPVSGAPNLYIYDSNRAGADRYRFVGTLSAMDAVSLTNDGNAGFFTPVNELPTRRTSRVSPDGQQIAFMSTASLTGYDNTDANNGESDAEIFAYDAGANGGQGALRCVSCNPSGQRPAGRNITLEGYETELWGAAFFPPYYTELYGSRVITDDGKRVFYNSYDALVPGDTNGKADVYQWEAPGSGDCTPSSSSYSPINDGCVSLISTGESPTDSEFIDASPTGRDVFFTTSSSLVPQDPALVDIYDAREGGGFPSPAAPAAPCEGEACQGPPAVPNDSSPASSIFHGPENPKQKKHKKRHHKKMGTKQKKAQQKRQQKKQKKKSKQRTNNNGRAAR